MIRDSYTGMFNFPLGEVSETSFFFSPHCKHKYVLILKLGRFKQLNTIEQVFKMQSADCNNHLERTKSQNKLSYK